MITTYVCTKCGSFYKEHYPVDEGTAPCDKCGATLVVVTQNESGVVTVDQVENALLKHLGDTQ